MRRGAARAVLVLLVWGSAAGPLVAAPLDEVPSATPPPTPADSPDPGIEGAPQADSPRQVGNEEVQAITAEITSEENAPGVDMLGGLFGDADQPGEWDHYDIGASVGPLSRFEVYYTRLIFAAGMWVIAFANWVLTFVLRFDLGRMLVDEVGLLTEQYAELLNGGGGGLPLKEFMMLLAVAHAGWQIFRHRGQAAAAELSVAVGIALVGGYMLANTDDVACRGMSVMGDLTAGMIALGSDPGQEVARADYCGPAAELPNPEGVFEEVMFTTFVHEPFLLLQWGVVPAEGTSCRVVADTLVATRSWDNDDAPRDFMRDAGCAQMAEFNRTMTGQRTAGAVAYAVSAAAFAAAVVVSAATLLVAQVAGALLVLALPFAVVVGIAPGTGRELLVRWGHNVLKVAVLFMGSGFFLALMTTSIRAVVTNPASESVAVRMVASVVLAWSLVLLRGRIFSNMRFVAASLAQRAGGSGVDAGAQGQGPGQAALQRTLDTVDTVAVLHPGTKAAVGAGRRAVGHARGIGTAARRVLLERHHRRLTGSQHPEPGEWVEGDDDTSTTSESVAETHRGM